jgi:hypothetical protein
MKLRRTREAAMIDHSFVCETCQHLGRAVEVSFDGSFRNALTGISAGKIA